MDDQLATMIISRLDDLKEDANRNFDLLMQGQRGMQEKFEAHERSDQDQFAGLHLAIATAASTQDAVATTRAKFWAGVYSCVSLILGIFGGIFGRWVLWGRGGH